MKAMSALESASSGAGASSTSSSNPTTWMAAGFETERAIALRQSIRGMEVQLVDLVFRRSTAGWLMDWLRMPLGCAAAAGNLGVVRRLLAAGVVAETPPEVSRPPPLLHIAAVRGQQSVVEELLKAGVDVNETDSPRHDRTALHCAAVAGRDSVVRALISAGANMDVLDATGRTPLHYACARGHRAVVVFLLLNRACTRQTVSEEDTPLHLAAYHNHAGVIEDLLSFGRAFTGFDNAKGLTALHVAAKCGRVEACIALLRGGADAAEVSARGLTPLDIAAWSGHTGRLLQVLTTAKPADGGDSRCSSSMALYYAVRANKPHTMQDLIALGADVSFRKSGKLPNLHYAAGQGAYAAVEILLHAGADVDQRFGGRTPLHMACSRSHTSTVQLLLRWDADENAKDLNDDTPSVVVGNVTVRPDVALMPEAFFRNQLIEDRIRNMLETAPRDRIWRRRGWLVLCRARCMARICEEENNAPKTPLDDVPGTSAQKRRGKAPGCGLVANSRNFSLEKGNAHGRNEGGGRRLAEAPAAAAGRMKLGPCGFLSYGGAGQAAQLARQDGITSFVAVVEQLLLLREDPIFREVVTFL